MSLPDFVALLRARTGQPTTTTPDQVGAALVARILDGTEPKVEQYQPQPPSFR